MTDAEEIRQNILFMEMTSEQTIAFTIRQLEETLLVAYNASGRKETLLLPDDRTWTLYIDDLHAGTRTNRFGSFEHGIAGDWLCGSWNQ